MEKTREKEKRRTRLFPANKKRTRAKTIKKKKTKPPKPHRARKASITTTTPGQRFVWGKQLFFSPIDNSAIDCFHACIVIRNRPETRREQTYFIDNPRITVWAADNRTCEPTRTASVWKHIGCVSPGRDQLFSDNAPQYFMRHLVSSRLYKSFSGKFAIPCNNPTITWNGQM